MIWHHNKLDNLHKLFRITLDLWIIGSLRQEIYKYRLFLTTGYLSHLSLWPYKYNRVLFHLFEQIFIVLTLLRFGTTIHICTYSNPFQISQVFPLFPFHGLFYIIFFVNDNELYYETFVSTELSPVYSDFKLQLLK